MALLRLVEAPSHGAPELTTPSERAALEARVAALVAELEDVRRGEGRIVSGSGRYAGASGSFRFRAVMGLDAAADGMLGDAFLQGQGSLSLLPR